MKAKVKVGVVTGSRADYGLLYPLIKLLRDEPQFDLCLIVTGQHLSYEFGYTIDEVKNDGFKVDKLVETLLSSDSCVGVTKSTGLGLIGFADAYSDLKPDLVIILGDRYESFAAAIAAYFAKIPIVHLHGGELTEGLIDDAIRPSITKMSFFHCVSTEAYRKRVIQLGEHPERVFTCGALGIDNILNETLLGKSELESELGITFGHRNILVTYHPVTLENNTSEQQFASILEVLSSFDIDRFFFTKPNADIYSNVIIKMIDDYVKMNSGRAFSFESLGRKRYLSMLKYVNCVMGNSSSGIIEVPSFGIPSIDVGDRQKGRIAAESVIRCGTDDSSIYHAIEKALSRDFAVHCKSVKNPYGDGHAAERILKILADYTGSLSDVKKSFYDIEFTV